MSLASTRSIDQVVNACTPVEALILAPDPPPVGDPLGMVAFWGAPPVAELAGLMCGHTVGFAGFLTLGHAPRGLELVADDPDIVADLDPRCCPGC